MPDNRRVPVVAHVFAVTLFLVVVSAGTAQGGVSYGDPAGGWTYIYTGDQSLTPFAACLDGKWNHNDAAAGGSDAWDGSAPGQMGAAGVAPAPGGAGIFKEGDTSFLRIQDPGDPRSAPGGGWADPGNRKITFTHNITSEVPKPTTILDDGVTLSFRARIPTTPPLDPLYPANGGPLPWVTAGYNIHDDGYGAFGIKQGTSGLGCICFSLAMDTDEGAISGNGLTMNKRNGTAVSANVDSYDSGGTENTLTGFDPTQWHEFWIQIAKDTSGGGTHKVTIWMDGDTANPKTFHVTAGTKSEDMGGWSGYLVMSLGRTGIAGSQDVDFFAYKAGLHDPAAARDPALAWAPSPGHNKTDVLPGAVLSWKPGDSAGKHDVYFGTDANAVGKATVADPLGVLVSQGQTATTLELKKPLEYGKTYYWRVDEIAGATVSKGDVWSFSTEPYSVPVKNVTATASSFQADMGPERTVDGSGLNKLDQHSTEPKEMWLSTGAPPNWIQFAFDKAYKLDKVLVWNSNQMIESFVGFGAKKVTVETSADGTTWTPVPDVPDFAQAPGLPGYAANTTVNLGGVVAKYVKFTITSPWGIAPQTGLAEVRFFAIPVQASVPVPATGAGNVTLDTTLSWRPGHDVTSHRVYFGTDQAAVAGGTTPAQTLTERSFTPGTLNLGTTYYWRVDEVGAIAYPGDVWSFTTQAYGVVDDFESYTDKAGQEVFSAWIDGFENPAKNGAVVGLATAVNGTFCDTTNFYAGRQSMPLAYDNTAAPLSEATLTLARDWTASGIKSLSLWFRGADKNTGQLYLKINNTKVPYNGNATDLAKPLWTRWNVDLSTVAGGVKNVTKLAVGIEGAGAKGTLNVDEIRLYPTVFVAITQPVITKVVRANGQAGTAASGSPVDAFTGSTAPAPMPLYGLTDEALVFSDRAYPWSLTPAEMVGVEYVLTFNTDRTAGEKDVTYTVTFSKAVTIYVTCDDRITDQQAAVDLVVAAFAKPGQFKKTDLKLYIHENATTDRPMSLFAADFPAGTYVFGAQDSGRNFYTILAKGK